MNAYPPDLLVHHYPLLLLSGLVAPAASAVDSAASSSAAAAAPLIDASTAFPTLAADLRALVAARGRDSPWDPARGRSAAFRSVLVDSVRTQGRVALWLQALSAASCVHRHMRSSTNAGPV
jgi:hypothetical protein